MNCLCATTSKASKKGRKRSDVVWLVVLMEKQKTHGEEACRELVGSSLHMVSCEPT